MTDDRDASWSGAFHCHPGPQLIQAVARRDEIRFEFQFQPEFGMSNRVDEFCRAVESAGPKSARERGPIKANVDPDDHSKVVVTYTFDGRRNIDVDRRAMLGAFAEMDVPISHTVTRGMRDVFEKLVMWDRISESSDLRRQDGAVATEAARRAAKGPGSARRSR